jgi:hypothetical protein
MARTCSTHGRRDACRILVGKLKGKRSPGRTGRRWKDNNVTWMARALLGDGPVNTPLPNTRKTTIENSPFLCSDL